MGFILFYIYQNGMVISLLKKYKFNVYINYTTHKLYVRYVHLFRKLKLFIIL